MEAWKERAHKDLGRRIQLALDRIGMTQTELARQIGTSHPRVNSWINRDVFPDGRFLVLMPKVLRCDAYWLLTGEGGPTPGEDSRDEILEKVEELCRLVRP